MPGEYCYMCYGSVEQRGSIYFCVECGLQQQVYEEPEAQDTVIQPGVRTYHQAKGRLKKVDKREDVIAAKDLCYCYIECLQHNLKLQSQALVQLYGANEKLGGIVRQLWNAALLVSRALEPSKISVLHNKMRVRKQESDLQPVERGQDIQNSAMLAGFLWHKILDPRLTLSVLLLALWYCRMPVTAQDLIRAAVSGTIPYLDMYANCKHILDSYHTADLWLYTPLRPHDVPQAVTLVYDVNGLSRSAGLYVPQINAGALLLRYCQELGLPPGITASAMWLFNLRVAGTHHLWPLRPMPAVHAHVLPLAVIAATLKMWYALNGSEPDLPPEVPEPPDWLAWSREVVRRACPPNKYLRTVAQLLSDSDDSDSEADDAGSVSFASYMRYLRGCVFKSTKGDDTLQRFDEELRSVGKSMAGLELAGEKRAQRGAGAHQTAGRDADDGSSFPEWDMDTPPMTSTFWLKSQIEAYGRQQTEDEELDPPLHQCHPHYAAVIIATAALGWTTPWRMHCLVTTLLKEMVNEEDIDPKTIRPQQRAPPSHSIRNGEGYVLGHGLPQELRPSVQDNNQMTLEWYTAWHRTVVEQD